MPVKFNLQKIVHGGAARGMGKRGGWGSVCVVVEGLGSMRGASKVQCSLKQPNCNPNFILTCSPRVLSVTTPALS